MVTTVSSYTDARNRALIASYTARLSTSGAVPDIDNTSDSSFGEVAVEILADTQPEADETFYLDVFNPVGASFENGLVQLTAVRTIVNDDGWYWG